MPNMKTEKIFREKSIERVSSPEQLDDYIRLSNPGVWFVLSAIIIILVGACIFGIFGRIDSVVPGVGVAKEGHMTCLIKKEYADHFTEDMQAEIEGKRYEISLSDKPVTVSEDADSYTLFLGDMQPGERVYEAEVEGTFEDGSYEAKVITERIGPFSFLYNNQ